jgi:pimeloyl-ACP methyl ester carboxylesterase
MRMAWLPGAFHVAEDFLAAGFAESVRRRGTALDLTFVDLELAHVGDRSALERLRSDVVLPARAAGVSIWLGGISLGGLFALDYAASHPGELDGLCLFAPYLGNRMLIAEIARAPGLEHWRPGELRNRRRTQNMALHQSCRRFRAAVPGFGQDDRFAAAHGLAAAPGRLGRRDRRHEWPTWLTLRENFFDSRYLNGVTTTRPDRMRYRGAGRRRRCCMSAAVHLGAAAAAVPGAPRVAWAQKCGPTASGCGRAAAAQPVARAELDPLARHTRARRALPSPSTTVGPAVTRRFCRSSPRTAQYATSFAWVPASSVMRIWRGKSSTAVTPLRIIANGIGTTSPCWAQRA